MFIKLQYRKKVTIIYFVLLIVYCFFTSGCNSRTNYKLEFTYSSINQLDISFNFDKEYYLFGHGIGDISDCSSINYPKCIIFGSTIIFVPKNEIFNKLEDGNYLGKNESLNIEYMITKGEIKLMGRVYKGYWFNVTYIDERYTNKPIPEKLKGTYFYSKTYGLLMYEHSSLTLNLRGNETWESETAWSTSGCGFFSNKYC